MIELCIDSIDLISDLTPGSTKSEIQISLGRDKRRRLTTVIFITKKMKFAIVSALFFAAYATAASIQAPAKESDKIPGTKFAKGEGEGV